MRYVSTTYFNLAKLGGCVRLRYSLINVAANILRTDLLIETRLRQYFMYLFVDTRKDHVDMFGIRQTPEALQVVQASGVDERDFTHTDDADLRLVTHVFHHTVKLIRYTEEERAIDLIYLNALLQLQYLLVVMDLTLVAQVDLISCDRDVRGLSHTTHKEEHGNQKTNLDGDCQVEDDGQEEGH